MNTHSKVLYFSLTAASVNAFYDFIERTRYDYDCSFRLFEKKRVLGFKHASDLVYFLDDLEVVSNLFVIIDYPSFYKDKKTSIPKDVNKTFDYQEAADIIRRTILKYPEILFLFDESWKNQPYAQKKELTGADFTSFLFGTTRNEILKKYHQYDVGCGDHPFVAIARGRTNLYDVSNLRYAIKTFMYEHLTARKHNYSLIQESRLKNLAICVEEEHSQNRFNSYALYANGFRVLPIFSARELKYVNDNKDYLNPQLIVRDYDLQFSDVKGADKQVKVSINENTEEIAINIIDAIRGIKFFDENPAPKDYYNRFIDLYATTNLHEKKEYDYWSNLHKIETLYITKGTPTIKINDQSKSIEKKQVAHLIGIYKPVSGLYIPFHHNKTIQERYKEFEIISKFHFKKRSKRKKGVGYKQEQEWEVDTNREHHNHGVPLDIYDLTKSMINRAEVYFRNGKYIRAAILASDTIEILNGFHESLTLQAYHILSISENAVAMNTIGSDEQVLCNDSDFRIDKIKQEISRMTYRKGSIKRRELKNNTLLQIYSDCRGFCRDKEHFKSENAFISAMASLSEGFNWYDLYYEVRFKVNKLCKIISKLSMFFMNLKNTNKTNV